MIQDSRFQIPDSNLQLKLHNFSMKIERFEDLDVWKDSRELCVAIRGLCNKEGFVKDFTLKDQILSSSGSIMDNIAEGYERGGNKELIQFLFIAKGSCGETRSQIYRALDLGYISTDESQQVITLLLTISKKLSGFISYLKKSELKGIKYK